MEMLVKRIALLILMCPWIALGSQGVPEILNSPSPASNRMMDSEIAVPIGVRVRLPTRGRERGSLQKNNT